MTRVRQAVQDDVPELVRLRAMLFENLGGDFFNPESHENSEERDGGWRGELAVVLKEQVASESVRILVVDAGDGSGLAACGIGTIEQRLPGPHLRNGRIGHVIGVITDPAHRRRGHSRAVLEELLDWFRHQFVARVDLYASAEGEPLYRALGFDDLPDPALYWRP
ncbi:GNAT family N-acetyltransferase [Streptomyces sp. NBC_00237]|uniref:GNAT family N-acetyltransferase n=1 Tax=Streptomyces sp. NBC_00237 TaxID=2975687 RepID=UPI0022525863|nr:GNAT family N-acetyltransferase [Streptomyces sp. NBC_00237]MCX5206576.1 GNAT family N-acetyltransferase [Streptomyces sp. NBC_00237]